MQMTEELKDHFSGIWSGFRKKAMETVAAQEAAYSRGRVAAHAVLTEDGAVIIEAGRRVDDSTIERAHLEGKLHALAAAVIKGDTQDFRDKAKERFDNTPDGIESRSLNSVDDAIEAGRYIGRRAGIDVT